MDPNATPPPENQPQGQFTQQPQMQPMQPNPYQQPGYPAPKNPKSKLAIVLGVILVLLIAAFVAIYFLFLSPAVQAKKASNAFMTAAIDGNTDKLVKLDGDDESVRGFLDNVAQSLDGDSYSLSEKTSKGKSWYFLYDVSGAKSKYARTVVEKKDGKWVVTSIVHGGDILKLVPDSQSSDASAELQSAAPTPTSSNQLACLAQEDYRYLEKTKVAITGTSFVTKKDNGDYNEQTSDMFFKPDSVEEDTAVSPSYDDWADFALKNSDKAWTYELKGSTFDKGNDSTADPTSVKLANERTAEAKRELISRGVPESRIAVADNIYYADDSLEGSFSDSIYRRVQLTIKNPCVSEGLSPGEPAGR